jgi:hypothetical protein
VLAEEQLEQAQAAELGGSSVGSASQAASAARPAGVIR